jgi:hypothetical protein
MKTGPSLPELLDLQNRLNETLTKYGRWMQNLPADEKELEEFAESFAWLDGTRSLVGGVGTLATAAGLMGVSAPVTAAVSAGSGGYTVGQAMKGYFQTAKLAQQREIMRTMMGNAQHLAGVVQQQIASGSAQQDAVFTDFQRADQHVRALEHHLGLRR